MNKYLVFLSVLLISSATFAQKSNGSFIPKNGKISGSIIDKSLSQGLEFASVAAVNLGDSSIKGGSLTNRKGYYQITDLAPGKYIIRATFLGFSSVDSKPYIISPKDWEISADEIVLIPKTEMLEAVDVTAQKTFVQNGIDRKVYNVGQVATATGGSASDVLTQIPSVDVDIDGNVSLRGSGNVTILVDGRPSTISGGSRAEILKQLPSESIENIEVITNPSAKYDPDGMSGIINIVLKKNKREGINGGISAGVGTWEKANFSANIARRNDKFNIYSNYSFRHSDRPGGGISHREIYSNDTTFILDQTDESKRFSDNHSIKAGADFFISPKNTIGFSGGINLRDSKSEEEINYLEKNNFGFEGIPYSRSGEENSTDKTYDFNVNYSRDYAQPNRKLTANVSLSKGDEYETAAFGNYVDDESVANSFQQNIQDNSNTVAIGQIDYIHPLGKDQKFEIGLKASDRTVDNDFYSESQDSNSTSFSPDTNLINRFIYGEKILASYGILTTRLGPLGLQVGLRAEQAFTNSELITTKEQFPNDYFSFFPSGHLNYKLDDKNQYQISYSRRINRPSLRSLNPFTDYDDPQNIRVGNPDLDPEYTNAYEFSYGLYSDDITFTSSVYYRRTTDVITRFRRIREDGVSVLTYENLTSATNYGIELIAMKQFFKWWQTNTSLNLYENLVDASNVETDLNTRGFAYSGKMQNSFTINRKWDMQLTGNYRSGRPFAQGGMKAMYNIDIAVKRTLMKNKATLSFNVRDVFNTRRFSYFSEGTDFYQEGTRFWQSRVAQLSFSWRFGKTERQSRRGGSNGNGGGGGDFDM